MRRNVSRAVVAAGMTLGGCGLIALPAQAADTLYFVNGPIVTTATDVNPQAATVSGYVDTGGSPGGTFSLASGGTLAWGDGLTVANTTSSVESISVEGIPVSGSNSSFLTGGTPSTVANGGADNYSSVEFEYDTLTDYTAAGNLPGPNTQFATAVNVPTVAGLSPVSATIGAYGLAAQTNTGNTPLKSDTTYVYWIVDQPGGTDSAESVNTFNPKATGASTSVNPNYQCLPTAYISANTYLKTLTSTSKVAGGVVSAGGVPQAVSQAGIQGPCAYFFGNVSGSDYYNSPAGQFETTALGKLSISSVAKIVNGKADVPITDKSTYKASGTLELDDSSGNELASGTFGLSPGKKGTFRLKLTKAGKAAAKKGAKGDLTLTSNWGQPTVTKEIKLNGKIS